MNEHQPSRHPVLSIDDCPAWNAETDVIVVGSGGSGLVAAVMAADAGVGVLVLEKGAETGGTTRKSGGGVWVPGNHHMDALGLPDSREGALRYMARTARPHLYTPEAANYGLPDWEYEGLALFVDEGATAFRALEEMGAFATLPLADFPNYYSALDEDVHKLGRSLAPREPEGGPADGPEMIRQLTTALEQRGGRIELEQRVVSVVVDGDRVVGAVADSPLGRRYLRAARAVVFASGGFTHNAELRRAYLQGPIFGGCAASTNEGDFVPIARSLGAEMQNMSAAWSVPIQLEPALNRDPALRGTFNIVGDSMLCVNKYGVRAMNEKAVYNEATLAMRAFDGIRCEYPNMLMFVVWDQANYDAFRGSPFDGGVMPAAGADDSHVIAGGTFAELAEHLSERLDHLAHATGGVRLAPDFADRLASTVARFNELARGGHDDDFGRGDTSVERHMHKLCVNAALMGTGSGSAASAGWGVPVEPEERDAGNPTLAPLADHGPYYAVILASGTLDTKGGPKTDRNGRILRPDGNRVPGVYAVGNCAASPSGQAYWGAGATLGPMITYAWLAGQHAAAAEPAARATG